MGVMLYTNRVFQVHTENPVLGSATRQDMLGKVPIGSLAQRLGSLYNLIVKKLGGVKWSSVQVTAEVLYSEQCSQHGKTLSRAASFQFVVHGLIAALCPRNG